VSRELRFCFSLKRVHSAEMSSIVTVVCRQFPYLAFFVRKRWVFEPTDAACDKKDHPTPLPGETLKITNYYVMKSLRKIFDIAQIDKVLLAFVRDHTDHLYAPCYPRDDNSNHRMTDLS